jgi:tetratricopeptide (TPR) repeat protein
MLLGLLLVLAPFTARNIALGSFTPVTGNLGVNLYIGNHPNATGTFTPLNEIEASSGNAYHIKGDQPDGVGQKTILDADPVLLRKSLTYITKNPLDWAALMFRKAMLYLNAYEIPDMEDYDFMRAQTMLKYLIPSMALIAPLGILGIWMSRKNADILPATAYLLAYGASFTLFFIKARFRIALMPVLILFAAHAFWQLHSLWQTKKRQLLGPICALIILTAMVNNPQYRATIEGTGMYNQYNNLGREYASQGQTDTAIGYYLKAIDYSPTQPEPYINLAEAYDRRGDYAKAGSTLRTALKISPDSPYAHNNLGTTLYSLNRLPEAEEQFKAAIGESPEYYEAHNNLATVYLNTGRTDEAISELREAARLNPEDETVKINLKAAIARKT